MIDALAIPGKPFLRDRPVFISFTSASIDVTKELYSLYVVKKLKERMIKFIGDETG